MTLQLAFNEQQTDPVKEFWQVLWAWHKANEMIDKRHKDGLKLSNLAHLVFPDISESLDWSVVFFSFSVGKYFCFSF